MQAHSHAQVGDPAGVGGGGGGGDRAGGDGHDVVRPVRRVPLRAGPHQDRQQRVLRQPRLPHHCLRPALGHPHAALPRTLHAGDH